MCTATLVPLEAGFRLVFNRDERRDRPRAAAPTLRRLNGRLAILPIDPRGGGTWIAVTDTGLAAALLNRTAVSNLPQTGSQSRGLVIPRLLESVSVSDALQELATIDLSAFRAFRLLLVQEKHAVVVTSTGTTVSTRQLDLTEPCLLTSSSLGDDVVEGPRRRLFESFFECDRKRWLIAQSRFHAHRWADRPAISVNMDRADAKTVSQSVVTVSSFSVRFEYRALDQLDPRSARAA